jgi:hypothetical protein
MFVPFCFFTLHDLRARSEGAEQTPEPHQPIVPISWNDHRSSNEKARVPLLGTGDENYAIAFKKIIAFSGTCMGKAHTVTHRKKHLLALVFPMPVNKHDSKKKIVPYVDGFLFVCAGFTLGKGEVVDPAG